MRAKTKPEPRKRRTTPGGDIDDPSWEIVDTWEHLETRQERIIRLMTALGGEWVSVAEFNRRTGMGSRTREMDELADQGLIERREGIRRRADGEHRDYVMKEYRSRGDPRIQDLTLMDSSLAAVTP